MLIAQRLEKLATRYDDSRRTVSLFLLGHRDEIGSLTMADVAAQTFTSKATLVRIAKQLGYPGWRAFAHAFETEVLRQREHATDVDCSIPFSAQSTPSEILRDLCSVRAQTAWQTAESQDARDLERAVGILGKAHRIALFGVSTNAILLELFQRKCMLIGIEAVQVPQAEFGLYSQTLDERDAALMVSYSGETAHRAPMNRIPLLRARNVPLVAITSEGGNYLRDNADVTLSILSQESLYNKIGTFSTEESVSCILDALYGCLFARNYERNLRFKTETARRVEVNRRPSDDL